MRNSFLMKDQLGHMSGYLMQCEDLLKCKVNAQFSGKLALAVFFGDCVSPRHFDFTCGRENEFNGCGETVSGAVLTEDGEAALWTGERARLRWEALRLEMSCKCKDSIKPAMQERKEKRERTERIEYPSHKAEHTSGLPERGWPPPPCVMNAIYQNGKWKAE